MKKISFSIPDLEQDDRGVSPVIGVILMVAITVILAAVIASFVLGFGDSVSNNVQAGADVSEQDNGNVSVTWISGGNADYLNVTVEGNSVNSSNADTGESLSSVGQTLSVNATAEGWASSGEEVTVIVTAVGSGGAETVITQKEVTAP